MAGSVNTVRFAPTLIRLHRSQHLDPETRKRNIHGQNPPAIIADNAAPIPQPAQFHDIWRVPA